MLRKAGKLSTGKFYQHECRWGIGLTVDYRTGITPADIAILLDKGPQ